MILKYLGHACFELELSDGRRIIFDPYESGSYDGALAYGPIKGDYDIAVVSHDHADHRSEDVIAGIERVIDTEGDQEIDGVRIRSFSTFHDESEGSERGGNLVTLVEAEGRRLAHLGDLGHMVDPKDIPGLKGTDIMLIPVGGHFTIDAAAAHQLVEEFYPSVVIPMHYKTEKVEFPIGPVEDFTSLEDNVQRVKGSELALTDDIFTKERMTYVLNPAL